MLLRPPNHRAVRRYLILARHIQRYINTRLNHCQQIHQVEAQSGWDTNYYTLPIHERQALKDQLASSPTPIVSVQGTPHGFKEAELAEAFLIKKDVCYWLENKGSKKYLRPRPQHPFLRSRPHNSVIVGCRCGERDNFQAVAIQ